MSNTLQCKNGGRIITQHNTHLLAIVVVVVIVIVVVMVVVVTILINILISSNSQLTAFALCAFRHRAPVSTPLF